MNSVTFDIEKTLEDLYGLEKTKLEYQKKRFIQLTDKYYEIFGQSELQFFSTPGRAEISGNHTDHNLGRVLAASINLDAIAAVGINDSGVVRIYSENSNQTFVVELKDLKKVETEIGTTTSLIRGIAARLHQLDYKIKGFNAVITSDVLTGSGLSSSACIEVLIATIFNYCFNNGSISHEIIAKVGQWSENNYFGKPCGLMDQLACAVGGIIGIDFRNIEKPIVEIIDFEFSSHGYKLLIVDTGSNHEDLTDDYASIPHEMKKAASVFNKSSCREISFDEFVLNLSSVREKVGDRAALRVFHFLNENERVANQVESLKQNNFATFLNLVGESGDSSIKWLQNIYSLKNYNYQAVTLALAFTEKFINDHKTGKCRVHGGGFSGTIQVFLPENIVGEYMGYLEKKLKLGKVIVLDIRKNGTVFLGNLKHKFT